MASQTTAASYRHSVQQVIQALGTDERRGLSEDEARARLGRYGPNELGAEHRIPIWRKILAQFKNVLVILLLIATAVSTAVWIHERDTALPYEAIAILAIVLLNALIGYLQESRAESALAALRVMTAPQAHVLRDGKSRPVPVASVVPGDIMLLEEGNGVPADGRLVQCTSLQTAEAALTGESLPASKQTAPLPEERVLGDRDNMVFSGTTVSYGRGRAAVVATGMQTETGRIARMLGEVSDETTPLQRELDRIGKVLGLAVVGIAVVMIATVIALEHVRGLSTLVDVLILGIALAVAAVPEGLPAVVTAVLSLGVQRMAKRNAIVRHLRAVETLGSADIIGSDKTGTLTKNEMTVRVVATASGQVAGGDGIRTERRGHARKRRSHRRGSAPRARTDPGRRRSRQQRDRRRARWPVVGARRSNRGRAHRRGPQGGARRGPSSGAAAARWRSTVLIGKKDDEHASRRHSSP